MNDEDGHFLITHDERRVDGKFTIKWTEAVVLDPPNCRPSNDDDASSPTAHIMSFETNIIQGFMDVTNHPFGPSSCVGSLGRRVHVPRWPVGLE
jgi:hypothetical protein